MTQLQTPPRIEADDAQKIRMYEGQAREGLARFAGAMVRLAALKHNPAFNLLGRMADTIREQLQEALK